MNKAREASNEALGDRLMDTFFDAGQAAIIEGKTSPTAIAAAMVTAASAIGILAVGHAAWAKQLRRLADQIEAMDEDDRR